MQGITNSAGSIIGLNSDLTLLWENPNPTSAFSAQTLNIDSSKYRYVVIKASFNSSNHSDKFNYFFYDKKNLPTTEQNYAMQFALLTTGGQVFRKITSISDSDIVFGIGGTYSGTNNGNGIPLAIYGCNNASIEESPTPYGKPVLLWESPTGLPMNIGATGSISVDCSQYETFFLEVSNFEALTERNKNLLMKNEAMWTVANANTARAYKITDDGIHSMGNGSAIGSTTQYERYCEPYRLYGVKKNIFE